MNSVYDFIVEPIGERYNNTTKVNDKELILNCNIESFKFINRLAKVIAIPKAYNTPIKKNDEIIIHHNVFRRYYDIRGKEKNSSKYFKDNLCHLLVTKLMDPFLPENRTKQRGPQKSGCTGFME